MRLAGLLAATVLAGCAATPQPPSPPAGAPGLLRNAGFEAAAVPGRDCPSSWWCSMHADPGAFAFGTAQGPGSNGRYLKVTRVRPEPWALVTQRVPAKGLAGRRLRFSVAVDAAGLDGGAGPVMVLLGVGRRAIDHRQVLVRRGPGWQRASVEIVVGAETEQVEFGLLVEGGGSVGFDDADAVVLPPDRP